MPLFAISLLIQIVLIIHVLRTGRERMWIWILIALPMIGGLAYLVVELIPEWRRTIGGQRALRQVKASLNPGGAVRQWQMAWEQSPNADNARGYAGALIANQRFEEALTILHQVTSGFFKHEPNLLLLIAEARYSLEQYPQAIEALETLIAENPGFKSAQGHLLYARALEQNQQTNKALEEYRAVAHYFPGAEARYRLGLALKNAGQHQESITEFEQILKDARLAPAHFRKSQKLWLSQVKTELQALTS